MLGFSTVEYTGIFLLDHGSNLSAISLDALRKSKSPNFLPCSGKVNTMGGEVKILGSTLIMITIGNITKKVLLYVIDSINSKYELILGLDLIPTFRISVNESLEVYQLGTRLISIRKSNVNETNNLEKSANFLNIELLDEKLSHLEEKKRIDFRKLLVLYQRSFAQHAFDVGNVKDYECRIDLSSSKFIAKKPYRCTYDDQVEINNQVTELLKYNMISESRSPFASPVTLQYKKVGLGSTKEKTRMCCDFRELNKITIPESQPFPLIDEIIIKSRGCSWYSALDINLAFWSIPIRPEDRHKSAFITQRGHYEWRSMPFGLKTAPATFQRILSGVLRRNGLSDFCINYLDDILVFSKSYEDHVSHLRMLFNCIYKEGFRLSFRKCNFAKQSIEYLGHVLSSDYVKPLNDNLISIQNFPIPSTTRHIKQFLGKINFYRKFIPNSASLLEPLHNLLRKRTPFVWSTQCQISFDTVKTLLTSEPILAIFDRTKSTLIYTDASGIGVGAVMKQKQDDGFEKPVAYFSRKLSEAQRKKKAIYIEAYAIREALRFWRYWLLGHRFTVITDHKPLEHLNLKARTDEELGDLAHELLQYDFDVIYRPGSYNSEADCLSRNPVIDPPSDVVPESPLLQSFNFLSLNDIHSLQSSIVQGPSDKLKSGVIFRKFKSGSYIVLDAENGKKLVNKVHSHFGHIGAGHCISIVSKHFRFPRMYNICREISRKCTVCIANKTRRIRRSGTLGHFGPASRPFEIMSLDTIGGFGGNNSSKRYLHLLVDHFSRYAFILCTSGQSSRDFISLLKSVLSIHHIETLLTDQYGGLSSDEFASFCNSSNINHVFVAVDCAFSNGLNERTGQTLVNRIRCARNDPSSPNSSWTSFATRCVSEYNSSPHSVTGFSPSYLLYGDSSNVIPLELCIPSDLVTDRELALRNSIMYHNRNKRRFDRTRTDLSFSVDDYVFIDNGNKLNRSKLDPVRIGPFRISKKLSSHVYEIDIGTSGNSKKLYHISKLLLL